MAYKAYLEVPDEENISLGDRIIYKTSWSIDKNTIDPKETVYDKKWDPIKISYAEVEVNIDTKKLFSVCGLSHKTELLLSGFWESTGSNYRYMIDMDQNVSKSENSIRKINFGEKKIVENLSFPIDFSNAKKDLRLIIKLSTFNVDEQNSEKFSAKKAGLLLWSETQILNLEGKGTLPPISFENSIIKNQFAWRVKCSLDDVKMPYSSSFEVAINLNSELGLAVKNKDPQTLNYFNFDVKRQLINNTLLNQDAVTEIENLDKNGFEDENGLVDTQSLGFLLHELIKNTFPNDDLKKLSDEIKQDYNGFQEKLQYCREFISLNKI